MGTSSFWLAFTNTQLFSYQLNPESINQTRTLQVCAMGGVLYVYIYVYVCVCIHDKMVIYNKHVKLHLIPIRRPN